MIKKRIQKSIEVKKKLLMDEELINCISEVSKMITKTFQNNGKVFFCGNGGSAADAQHLAAELSGKFNFDRPPLNAEACHVNSSFLTAVSNDYSYEIAYARYIEAGGNSGDVVIGLSTSGNSRNVVKAFEKAKSLNMKTVAFTGESGGRMKELADYLINVPSSDTPRIQEAHILAGHIVCEIVENNLFKK